MNFELWTQTKDHGHWFGNETSAHVELTIMHSAVAQSLSIVVGKAHGHQVGKALLSVAYLQQYYKSTRL